MKYRNLKIGDYYTYRKQLLKKHWENGNDLDLEVKEVKLCKTCLDHLKTKPRDGLTIKCKCLNGVEIIIT